jgi:hypothetical protein
MKIYLRAFVLNLTKNNEEIKRSSFIPARLKQIERDMEAKKLTVSDVMDRLRDEEKFRKALGDRDWKMIESEVKKMIK